MHGDSGRGSGTSDALMEARCPRLTRHGDGGGGGGGRGGRWTSDTLTLCWKGDVQDCKTANGWWRGKWDKRHTDGSEVLRTATLHGEGGRGMWDMQYPDTLREGRCPGL